MVVNIAETLQVYTQSKFRQFRKEGTFQKGGQNVLKYLNVTVLDNKFNTEIM